MTLVRSVPAVVKKLLAIPGLGGSELSQEVGAGVG